MFPDNSVSIFPAKSVLMFPDSSAVVFLIRSVSMFLDRSARMFHVSSVSRFLDNSAQLLNPHIRVNFQVLILFLVIVSFNLTYSSPNE